MAVSRNVSPTLGIDHSVVYASTDALREDKVRA